MVENFDISILLTTESILTIIGIAVSLLIAIVSGIYAIITNTKKYELTERYRQEILQWYTSAVNLMIKIINYSETEIFFKPDFSSQRIEMLSELSSLIEVGRFYFPNVIKGDNYGDKKPAAYQGYRDINLEFLIYFYRTASKSTDSKCTELLWELERRYTSAIFNLVNPRKRNKDYTRYLAITIPEGTSGKDYIEENLNNTDVFVN